MTNQKENEISQLLIELYEKTSAWEHAVVKESGLSPAQMHAVEIVGHHEKLRMKELANKMGITTGTLTVMVDRLEKKGLVNREPHPTDRRSYIIVLTDLGREHFHEHDHMHNLLTTKLTAPFKGDEIDRLKVYLERLVHQF
ncbi:MarR family transcriptional regulator [Desulfoluna sp.]|uniref:MarR family winged helix-turn-helix transcriptional regulator n=1 Tax=Desulfoluna sp. TaxID=2045199 RepID=UPI00260E8166|nr:MarR family transcriptional regulator [Desulfoluna sp.]